MEKIYNVVVMKDNLVTNVMSYRSRVDAFFVAEEFAKELDLAPELLAEKLVPFRVDGYIWDYNGGAVEVHECNLW